MKGGVQKKYSALTPQHTTNQETTYLVEKLDALQGKYVESLHNEKTLKDQLKAFLSEYEAKLPVLRQQKTNYEELLIAYNSVKIELEDSREVNCNLEETFKKSTIETESLRKEHKDLQKTVGLLSSQVKTLFNENFQLKNYGSNSPSTVNLMNMQDLQYKYLELQTSMEDIVHEKDSIIEDCMKDKEILNCQLIETEQKLANSHQTASDNKGKEQLYILEHFYQQELQKISKTTEDRDELLRKSTVLAKTNKELEILYQAAKSELEMIREENKSLTGKYMKTEQEISNLLRNYSISQHNIIKLSEEVNTLKSIIQTNKYSRKVFEENYENLHVSYLHLHEAIKESDRRVVTLQEMHSAEISKFLQEKIRYHTEINKKQTELANNRQHWAEELTKLKEEVETYKLNQESFSDSVVLLSKTIEISSIKSELERETGNNSILLKKVKELQSYKHYKEQYEMTKEELSMISQDNEVLKTNNEIYKLTNQELSSYILSLRKNYTTLEGKFLNAKTYSSEGQLSSLLQNIDSLSEQKIRTDTLCEKLIAEKSQLSQENQYLKSVLQNQPSAPPLLYQLVSLIHKSLSN